LSRVAIHVERNPLYGFPGRDRLDLASDFVSPALKFCAELGRNSIGPILIGVFERSLDRAIH
jgi:hypothetical protein